MVEIDARLAELCFKKIIKMKNIILIILLLSIPAVTFSQEKKIITGGFIRGSTFISTGDYKYDLSSLCADFDFNLTATDNFSYKGYADMRYRTGQQLGSQVNELVCREAYLVYYKDFFSISAGKKIIKWGKTYFFTPNSKLNPSDLVMRSPDREDMDLGNILVEIIYNPASYIRFTAVYVPLWNPSLLMTAPLELPANINIRMPGGVQTNNGFHSLGIRNDLFVEGFDIGLQWYNGPENMPGLKVDRIDFSNPLDPLISLEGVPYRINLFGIDFEGTAGPSILRGSFTYFKPIELKENNEEIPFPQVEWVAGVEYSPGSLRVLAEYSGKRIIDYYQAPYDPILGSNLTLNDIAALMALPDFDITRFIRLQTEAFNRLYNNQLMKMYHSFGLRIEGDFVYGKLSPSLSGVYNFSSHDLLVIPAIRYKPSDGLTLSTGLEHYSGSEGGLYNLIDDFMCSIFFSLRVDF